MDRHNIPGDHGVDYGYSNEDDYDISRCQGFQNVWFGVCFKLKIGLKKNP